MPWNNVIRTPNKIALIFFAGLLLSACASETPEEETSQEKKSISIESVAFQDIAIAINYNAPATAVSLNESQLKAEISARIDEIPARVGDVVKQGDALVQLNCADAKAQYQQSAANQQAAAARKDLADQQYQRALSLKKRNSVSEELLNQRKAEASAADADYKAASAALQVAQNQRSRCTIKAPFNAVVTQRVGQVGELASAGSPLIKVIATDGMEVSANIQPYHALSLDQATEINFVTGNTRYPLTLRAITGAIDSLTRTQEARLQFTQEYPLPGTPGRLEWSDTRMGVPANLLTERSGQLGVFTVENDIAQFMPLDNAEEGRAVAVDLAADVQVVTQGRLSISSGDTVETAE